jgi:2-amino-4-hydroxy-6-hydroxymethyldihydropteridine diphosphokinase
MVRAALGLGSNIGDRRAHLAAAVRGLGAAGPLVATSSLYETAPVGGPEQGPYLNAVVVVDTALAPRPLFALGRSLERAAGRRRRVRWGPRTLDVDLLLYGEQIIEEPGLVVPHPRLAERCFALAPLAEAWPGATLPDGTAVTLLLAVVADQQVAVVAGPGWWEPPA